MKKKRDEHDTEDALAQSLGLCIKNTMLADEFYLKHLDIRLKFLYDSLASKKEFEPCKLFKKTHKKWEDEVKAIEDEIQEVYVKIGETVEENQKFLERMKSGK